MSNLINIETKNINGGLIQTVNARDLHAFLGIKNHFKDWIKDRIEKYGFLANEDFVTFAEKTAKGRPSIEYAISLDMAKELSMVERNEKGKQARQYFIECERRVLQPQTLLPTAKELALMVVRAEEEKEQLLLENKSLSTENDCLKNLFKEGMTPTQFSKMLNGVNSQQINHFLAGLKWLYNESKSGNNLRWRVAATARDKYLTEKQNEISPHGANSFISYRPVLLRKGAQRLYDQYLADKLPMKKNWNGLHTHDKTFQIVA
ncbi:antA/AntB antirepressor family protein [Arsenophonus nasoniae]|uniref:AntA/AntB antirepressor family protein n=1 Tax=Arsenophonus nasoniae TaxID=638 RepID=A0ABY8NVA3_9GAMM|nr:antA/AntB antirepressor family protein [Arsenophonus nasoniae]WGM07569.1 antA/AntB antirepressor family protein [Arsenophonus nasoniae]